MSFGRDEARAKVGKRVQIHDDVDDNGGMYFSKDIPVGTTGQVIHANLVHRFTHEEYEPADRYELVIAWEFLGRRVDRFDDTAYRVFVTELE